MSVSLGFLAFKLVSSYISILLTCCKLMDACPKATIFLYTVPSVSKALNHLSPFFEFCSAGFRECLGCLCSECCQQTV